MLESYTRQKDTNNEKNENGKVFAYVHKTGLHFKRTNNCHLTTNFKIDESKTFFNTSSHLSRNCNKYSRNILYSKAVHILCISEFILFRDTDKGHKLC